jgi:uncharacterized protein YkwD
MFKHRSTSVCSALWLLSCAAALVLSGRPGTAGAAEDKAALDRQVDQTLREVIRIGAGIYNGGDPAGCYRLFEGALMTVRPQLDQRPELQKAIDRALADAGADSRTDRRAFILRAALDRVRDEVRPAQPGPKEPKTARPTEVPAGDGGLDASALEKAILTLVNKERARQGLAALKPNAKLFQAARFHSVNMARQERLDHTLDGKDPGDRLREVGYRHAGWGENCAAGQRSAEEVLNSWMNSSGHRANILTGRFTEAGVAAAVSASGDRYYTLLLATPGGTSPDPR